MTLLASSSAPTPLYVSYQARWGFSDIALTVTFAVYAVAVLVALVVVGSLSDHVGRRPVLIASLGMQTLVMLLFAEAGGLDALLLARVLQGLATGAALGAIGAGLVDLHPSRGPVANAAALQIGTASGALVAALLVQYLPAPTQLVYLLLAGLFILQLAGVTRIAESAERVSGALRSLRPTVGVPARLRAPLLIATPSLVAVWTLAGFFLSIGPSLIDRLADSHSAVLGGAAVFVLAFSGAMTVLVLHRTEARRFALGGNVAMILGVGILLTAISEHSAPLFFLGAVVAGSGFGAGFQGGLRTVVEPALAAERAGVLSVAYVISYLAMGLPAILAGVIVTRASVTHTAEGFSVGIIALATLTVLGLIWSARRRARPVPRLAGVEAR